ncbi:MAG: STAS domain-containing protein [Bryobacteraceae bacterium]|nr:STAS domain-containing protein [Bryobacteraceae bacterium]
MGLEITDRIREGVVILSLRGRIAVGESTKLRDRVTDLQQAGHTRQIFDLAEIDYIDSTGLGSMVICHTALTKAGGGLKLLNLNKRNVELLVLTKLHTIFDLYNDEQDAVNSFFADRKVTRFDILSFVQEHAKDTKEEL